MKALIFSAGLGTRLKPYTNTCPKALVELNNKPLIWYAIRKLINAGATDIVVNIHHFGEQIIQYFETNRFEVPIHISDERTELLDTGGGLLKASEYLNDTDTIVAYNVDVISNVNLEEVIRYHQQEKAIATLVVRKRETGRYLMFDTSRQLCGWKNIDSNEEKISRSNYAHAMPYAFSGIQVVSPSIFEHISEKGRFSIIDMYLHLAKVHTIKGYYDESDFWLDLGKPGQLEEAQQAINNLSID